MLRYLILCLALFGATAIPLVAKGGLEVYPSEELIFPETGVGSVTSLTITLVNESDTYASIAIQSVVVEEGADDFSFDYPDPLYIPYGQSAEMRVYFHPQSAGARTGEIIIDYSEGVEVGYEELNCTGEAVGGAPQAEIAVTPEIDFGTVTTTADIRTDYITISNNGSTAGTITGIIVPAGSGFTLDSPLYFPVPVDAYTYVVATVAFRPLVEGFYETTATVQTSEGNFPVVLRGLFDIPDPPPQARIEVFPDSIDFGTVTTTADIRTAMITISNAEGTAPATLAGLSLPPGGVFTLETALPSTLEAGAYATATIAFRPQAEGEYETTAVVQTSEGYFQVALHGVLRYPAPPPVARIEVTPAVIDFGIVTTTADIRTDYITISNTTGTAPATLAGLSLPPGGVFTLETALPGTVAAGSSVAATIAFRPQAEGVYETTAVVQAGEGEFTVILRGEYRPPVAPPYYTASISVPELTADVGEEFALPFMLDAVSQDAQYAVDSCRIVLRFNASLMALRTTAAGVDSIAGGMRTTALAGPVSNPAAGAPLFSVPMVAALGDAEATVLEVLSVQWFDAAGAELPVATTLRNGRLTIGDIWRHGGIRLVNSNAGSLSMDVSPNPVHDRAVFRLGYREAASLVVYDVRGNTVLTLTAQLPAAGTSPVTIEADMTSLSAGTYYCRLSAGKFSLVRTLRVE